MHAVGINPADEEIPEHVPFVLIGAGTASFAAYRAIKKENPDAKVHHNLLCKESHLFCVNKADDVCDTSAPV